MQNSQTGSPKSCLPKLVKNLPCVFCLFVLRFYGPANPLRTCRAWSVYLTTLLLGRLSPLSCKPACVLILSPETDNCPSWISGSERMTGENISWSISTKECCQTQRWSNPQPADHHLACIWLIHWGRLYHLYIVPVGIMMKCLLLCRAQLFKTNNIIS